MNCSPLGSSAHEILQARTLKWVAIPFSMGSSWPRDQTQVSYIAGRFFTTEPLGKGILYYSAIKKNEIMPFAATWMCLQIIILSGISQIKTNIIWYHLYVESKIWHKWIYLQNRNSLIDTENRLVVAKWEEVEKGKDWEFRISKCELLYLEWVKNKVLLQGTRNYIQYLMVNHNVKE